MMDLEDDVGEIARLRLVDEARAHGRREELDQVLLPSGRGR